MNYEIVELKEKIVVGVCTKTGNSDPMAQQKIGKLWKQFFEDGVIANIQDKANEYTIGLYSDYEEDGYTVTVGCEVNALENEDLAVKVIPAGKYAKFSIQGNMVTAVCDAWSAIWQMDLDRSYTGDFEEYHNADCENADIAIYIALK